MPSSVASRAAMAVIAGPARCQPAQAAAACFLDVPVLAGGDEPVRAGDGEVGPGQVAGVGEEQPDAGGRAAR